MTATLEREVVRERLDALAEVPAPPVRGRPWLPWMVAAFLVIAVGVFWWLNSSSDEFTWQDFAAAEDALAEADITPIPAPGITWQEFAAAEDAIATVPRFTAESLATEEGNLGSSEVAPVPAPGLTWQEFAVAEDQVGR